jgi:hypothetical protein
VAASVANPWFWKSTADVVAHLDLALPFDFLHGQTTVADKLATKRFENPQPKAKISIVRFIPINPLPRLIARLRTRVVLHHAGIAA